jgi:hypothetical protein
MGVYEQVKQAEKMPKVEKLDLMEFFRSNYELKKARDTEGKGATEWPIGRKLP